MDNNSTSLKNAFIRKDIKTIKETKKVLLSVNEEVYSKFLAMLKDNNLTFNSFINNMMILILDDKVMIETKSLKELTR